MSVAGDITFGVLGKIKIINGSSEFKAYPTVVRGVSSYLAGGYAGGLNPGCMTSADSAHLFGQFVLITFDPVKGKVIVLTDRFGTFPMYMVRHSDSILFSTNLSALAERCGMTADINHGAVSDILAFNVPLEGRTPFLGITSLAGGMELSIDVKSLAVSRRKLWDPVALLAQADLSFAAVKDKLVDLFLEGVEVATAEHAVTRVTLSGGADSRCLMAASLYLGKETAAYSTGVPGSRALSYAKRMADLCGVSIHSRPLNAGFISSINGLMERSNSLMQGMSFSSEIEALWLREQVPRDGVLLHGAFAELYKIGSMHHFYYDRKTAKVKPGELVEHLWNRFQKRYLSRLNGYNRDQRVLLSDMARQHLAAKVAHYQCDLDTAGVLQMIYIDEFLGKVVKSSWNMWRERIPTMFPFAYPPLVDLLLRVKSDQRIQNDFVVHLLKRTNKSLAHFPDSNTGVRVGASVVRREAVHVMDYAAKRLLPHKRSFDHQDFADWLANMPVGLETVFEEMQEKTGAFDLTHVAKLIKACRSNSDEAARTLHYLWAWGIWLTEKRIVNNEARNEDAALPVGIS